jgi:hypothetical protein
MDFPERPKPLNRAEEEVKINWKKIKDIREAVEAELRYDR